MKPKNGHTLTTRLDAIREAHDAAVYALVSEAKQRQEIAAQTRSELEAESLALHKIVGVV